MAVSSSQALFHGSSAQHVILSPTQSAGKIQSLGLSPFRGHVRRCIPRRSAVVSVTSKWASPLELVPVSPDDATLVCLFIFYCCSWCF